MSASHLLRLFIPCGTHDFHFNCSITSQCTLPTAGGPSRTRLAPGAEPRQRLALAGRAAVDAPCSGPAGSAALAGHTRLRVLSHSQHPGLPRSKELCILGSQPACDFPVARVQRRLPLALADARKTFCKPGKFPVLTLCLTGVPWQLQTENSQGA